MHNYIVVGAGGTGTLLLRPLFTYLAAHHAPDDAWMLWIIDGDVVEAKNLSRQLFDPGHITVNKAVAAAQSLGSATHVKDIPEYLSEDNLARYIKDGDTVLICVDNFTVRRRIEDHVRTLDNAVVINGGNELFDGSVQLWVREKGEDQTPRIGYLHSEVAIALGEDRAEMTCAQAAALPGGEQSIIANMQSATWMLTALWRAHERLYWLGESEPSHETWTELQFDAMRGSVHHIDQRMSAHWRTA